MLVGSNTPLEIGSRRVSRLMNARTQTWEGPLPYVVLEEVSEEEFAKWTLDEFGFELDPLYRGAYYYRISID